MPGNPAPTAAMGTYFFRRALYPDPRADFTLAAPPSTSSDRVGKRKPCPDAAQRCAGRVPTLLLRSRRSRRENRGSNKVILAVPQNMAGTGDHGVSVVDGVADGPLPSLGQLPRPAEESLYPEGVRCQTQKAFISHAFLFSGTDPFTMEAGCKTLVGKRLKQSGMFWSEGGATAVLNFRTLLLSGRFDAFWADRANRHAARNDALALAA